MEKIKINLLTAIFLSLCFIVLVNDYFTYIFDWNYYVSMLVSTCVSLPFFYFVSKKFSFVNDFEKIDLLFYLLLFAVFAITIVPLIVFGPMIFFLIVILILILILLQIVYFILFVCCLVID